MAFWRFGVDKFLFLWYNVYNSKMRIEVIAMQDVRVSVRLTKEDHEQLKILVIKKNTTINKFLLNYIKEEIKNEQKKDK